MIKHEVYTLVWVVGSIAGSYLIGSSVTIKYIDLSRQILRYLIVCDFQSFGFVA
jgi:hypothetical protein